MFLAGIRLPDGTIDGAKAALSPRVVPDGRTFAYVLDRGDGRSPEKRITQNDIRAIQLAKAELYAGVKLLMVRMGVDRARAEESRGGKGWVSKSKYRRSPYQ